MFQWISTDSIFRGAVGAVGSAVGQVGARAFAVSITATSDSIVLRAVVTKA
jgi:hypothetical protein